MNQIQSKIITSGRRSSDTSNALSALSEVAKFGEPEISRAHSFATMTKEKQNFSSYFDTSLTHQFDIFKFAVDIGRPHALPYLIIHLLDNLPI
jgi:hypothetical protein